MNLSDPLHVLNFDNHERTGFSRRIFFAVITFLLIFSLLSCGSGKENSEEKVQSVTPVTITKPLTGTLTDTVEVNATSSFLLKTNVRSVINGYIQEVSVKPGDKVNKEQPLFKIRSKEASSLGNILNNVDSAFQFKGVSMVKSPANGYITQISFQTGDYVQEGESLATISDQNSLVFLLDLPYELTPFLPVNKHLIIRLPDGRKIPGTLVSSMPSVDPASQTQNYVIRMDQYQPVPENLVARVNFTKKVKANTISLPKEAVLTDEQQSEFWIMKMTGDSTAVRVPIKKGIETPDRIEILSPPLKPDDRILLTGNYGLPDTAKVKVVSEKE